MAHSFVLPHTTDTEGILRVQLLLEVFINGFQEGGLPIKVRRYPTHLGVPLAIVETEMRLDMFCWQKELVTRTTTHVVVSGLSHIQETPATL